MKIFSNVISLIATAGIAVGTMYIYFPAAYAAVADHVPFLPITKAVKKAAPGREYDRLLTRIEAAATDLQRGRARLLKNRGDIEAMIREYTSRKDRAEILLNDARRIYRANPHARVVNFINQPYTLQDFGIQIEAISRQNEAYDKSLKTLSQARIQLNDMWTELAARESQLAADRAIVVAAKATNQATHLIDGLNGDTLYKYTKVNQSLDRQLRTITELLNEAESYEPAKFSGSYTTAGLSDNAKQILAPATDTAQR